MMFVDYDCATAQTPLVSPMHYWEEIRPGGVPRPPAALWSKQTAFSVGVRNEFDVFSANEVTTNLTGAEGVSAQASHKVNVNSTSSLPTGSAFGPSDDPVRDVASQRVRLMAAKYVGDKPSREVLARLAILDEKMLALSPRVSEQQLVAVEALTDELTEIHERRVERARRLGLPM